MTLTPGRSAPLIASSPDPRGGIYRDLHENRHLPNAPAAFRSAEKILHILFEAARPKSVLDIGCGLGTWLSTARRLGAEIIKGVEGPWLDLGHLCIEPENVMIHDLEKPIDVGCRFDLVISLEVAEHLSVDRARGFVENLVHHGDTVLFSAAIPFQGGHNHLNEQWPAYWAEIFRAQGYRCLDVIRPRIWDDPAVFWHLRQNILLFVSEECPRLPVFQSVARPFQKDRPQALVHPDAYCGLFHVLDQLNEIRQRYDDLIGHLSKGGTFQVDVANGELNITRSHRPVPVKDPDGSSP